MVRFFYHAIGAAALLVAVSPAVAQSAPHSVEQPQSTEFQTAAPVALLLDLSSETSLYSKNSDRIIQPASMTKIMTSYVALDLIQRGELSLGQKATVRSATAARWSGRGSTMKLRAGDQPTVEQLLDGIITLSGNDAAVVLAETIDGSEAAFVERMNRMASTLGMSQSRFGTATGWPDGGFTVVSAADLARLSRRLLTDFPQYYARFYGRPSFSWNGVTQPNRNPLIGVLAGADGIKTGHTSQAGYCFVGSAERDGRRLLMVVAGLPTMAARQSASVDLMRWGFDAWESLTLFSAGQSMGSTDVQLGNADAVEMVLAQDVVVSVPRGSAPQIRTTIRYAAPETAPVKANQQLGVLVIDIEGQPRREVPIVAKRAVARGNALDRVRFGFMDLYGLAFGR